MKKIETNLAFENSTLSICLDPALNGADEIAASYKKHGRFGFSYQPYGDTLAKEYGLEKFLSDNINDADDLKGVVIECTLKDVGISTSFLRGLLKPVLDFSPFQNWSANFHVNVIGRYENTTAISVIAFAQGELMTGKEYVEYVAVQPKSPTELHSL